MLKEQKPIYHSSGSYKSKIKDSDELVSPEAISLAYTWSLLTATLHFLGVSSSSYTDTNSVDLEPTFWPHLTLITSLKALSPKTVTLGLKLQQVNFEWTQILSITLLGQI